jgi:hypothetical protein
LPPPALFVARLKSDIVVVSHTVFVGIMLSTHLHEWRENVSSTLVSQVPHNNASEIEDYEMNQHEPCLDAPIVNRTINRIPEASRSNHKRNANDIDALGTPPSCKKQKTSSLIVVY